MMTVPVDDRYVLLALDRVCRNVMREFERSTLPPAARAVARALQDVPESMESKVGHLRRTSARASISAALSARPIRLSRAA